MGAVVALETVVIFQVDCSFAQLQSFVDYVVYAAELVQQPRDYGKHASMRLKEAQFANILRNFAAATETYGLDTDTKQQVTAAWQQLQRSGVLEARGIHNAGARFRQATRETLQAAVDSSMSAPGLRSCALASCGTKEAHPQHFKLCAACKAVVYCSREHQVQDWPAHKAACKLARNKFAAE